MTKKFLILFCVFFTASLLYGQENDTETGESLNLLLHTNKKFAPLSFQFYDGPPAGIREILKLGAAVPENIPLIASEKFWWNTAQVCRIVTAASGIGALICLFADDFPYQQPVSNASAVLMGTSFLGSIAASQAASSTLLRIVDNYNLYILGIPVKSGK
ncbi:MAG: hypothetical protein LBU18_01355 [Treponema sp.]|jgi:hypothetical protein|nr:hypothetical protein [Treponema sp.]